MEDVKTFQLWARREGIKLFGIAAHRFEGRGLGIIAERRLEAGDVILIAPISTLRSAKTFPKKLNIMIDPISVNGLLATEFSEETPQTGGRGPWLDILPTAPEIKESMPFFWHPDLQALLPSGAATLVEKHKKKIETDWFAVERAFSSIEYDDYVYNWFLVSTRTFYYKNSNARGKRTKLSHDDCIALIPLADNFNHADVGCQVLFSPEGYTFTANRRYEAGEEVFISYGDHNNDFLLAEYGFILEENKWDSICLDEVVLKLFSEFQTQELKDAGFLGKFMLNKDGVCYRTQVAVRLLCMPVKKWQRLVENGVDEKDKYQAQVDEILHKALKTYLENIHEKMKKVEVLDCGTEGQRQTLTKRWGQIRQLLIASIEKIENLEGTTEMGIE